MKLKIIIILFFVSCIDIITYESVFNSLYFSGGSWIELQNFDQMKIDSNSNDFSLQFWISGGEVDTNQAPALFSIVDSIGNVSISILRDPNANNKIIPILNSQIYSEELENVDFSNPDKFYLISILFSNDSNIKCYIDSTMFEYEIENSINYDNKLLVVGAIGNKERSTLKNFWYGYIDEIRLWNTHLSDTTIIFQSKFPSKVGDNYRYTNLDDMEIPSYLDSLVGIWRLNFESAQIMINDDSNNNYHGNIFNLPGFSIQLSDKGAE